MKHFTIFGNPVEHSKSPNMHNNAFKHFDIDAEYTKTRLDNGSEIKSRFEIENISGANVTVPFKEDAYNLVDVVVEEANEIKAINTIVNKDGKLYGYNTDGEGFLKSIEEFGKIKKALIIGAGGTAKSISVVFAKNSIDFDVLNRSEGRLEFFKDLGYSTYSWDSFEVSEYDIIINTTSAGLSDTTYPIDEVLLKELFSKAKFAVDVIYGKDTPFLSLAKDMNLIVKDGKDMLLYQGVLAFDKFTNHEYKLDLITKYLKEGLEKS
jgi:shikimate dehydrogenase